MGHTHQHHQPPNKWRNFTKQSPANFFFFLQRILGKSSSHISVKISPISFSKPLHPKAPKKTCQLSQLQPIQPIPSHPIPSRRTAWFPCRSSPSSARLSAPGPASSRPWPAPCWLRAAWTPCSAWPRRTRRARRSGWSRGPSWRERWRRRGKVLECLGDG